jgi:hypothetical protein
MHTDKDMRGLKITLQQAAGNALAIAVQPELACMNPDLL